MTDLQRWERLFALTEAILVSIATWCGNGYECCATTDPSDPERHAYLALCERMYAKRGRQMARFEAEEQALATRLFGPGVEEFPEEEPLPF